MDDKPTGDTNQLLKSVISELPLIHRTSLMFLINFMRDKILPKEEVNKMGVQNLAICFAPCWFRSEVASIKDILYATKSVAYAKLLISEFDTFFGSEEER